MNNESATRIAKRFLQAMAYNRETFKDKVEEHVGGAYLEFYKATLANRARRLGVEGRVFRTPRSSVQPSRRSETP